MLVNCVFNVYHCYIIFYHMTETEDYRIMELEWFDANMLNLSFVAITLIYPATFIGIQ